MTDSFRLFIQGVVAAGMPVLSWFAAFGLMAICCGMIVAVLYAKRRLRSLSDAETLDVADG
jgi:hypothetical protein